MSLDKFLAGKKNLNGFHVEKDPDIIGLDFSIIEQEHKEGIQIADNCMIDQMSECFAWMRGHQNCWTGFPNDGKTQFTLFMMIVKMIKSNWKWVIWSPEMKSANFIDNKVKVHYNLLAYEIMATISGKTPHKHIHNKYNVPLMTLKEKKDIAELIKDKFIFLNPKKKDIKSIYELLKNQYEQHGYDGILIDPFKNIEAEHNVRDDKHLHDVFANFKDFAVETNTVMNWIAHPKSGVTRVKNDGTLNPCNQYMLSGGAAWDNSMDGIYSIQRPDTADNPTSSRVIFHNLKQRMQELVCNRGEIDCIDFDIKTRRYLFDSYDVMGGKQIEPKIESLPVTGNEVANFEVKDLNKILDEHEKGEAPF
jgi:hypothetical protein